MADSPHDEVRTTRYTIDGTDLLMPINIEQVGRLLGGRFDPHANVWAVRWQSRCLNDAGEWEFEPLPSSRDDDFLRRTRWPLQKAIERARRARRQPPFAASGVRSDTTEDPS